MQIANGAAATTSNQLGQQWEAGRQRQAAGNDASQGSLPPISMQHSSLPPQVLPVGNRISAEQKLQTGQGRGGDGRTEGAGEGGRQSVALDTVQSVVVCAANAHATWSNTGRGGQHKASSSWCSIRCDAIRLWVASWPSCKLIVQHTLGLNRF